MAVNTRKKKPKFESEARKELESIRWRLGLTQQQMSARLNLKPSTYENYERGRRKLPYCVLGTARALEGASSDYVSASGTKNNQPQPKTLGIKVPADGVGEFYIEENNVSYWSKMRQECRAFRAENYSRPARILLSMRDYVYMLATFYFALKQIALAVGLPFGIEVDGIDYAFIGSFFLICILFISFVQDLPIMKAAKYLALRG